MGALGGARFIDAVAAAREKARECGGSTWAAYQCYGDPYWRFRPQPAMHNVQRLRPREFAGIASAPSLILALEQIAVESEYQGKKPDDSGGPPALSGSDVRPLPQDRGDVAEAFGNAWSKSGRFAEAIVWYERARAAEDGTARSLDRATGKRKVRLA